MKFSKQSLGFSVVEATLIIGVVAVLGLVGFNVYARNQDKKTDTATTQAPVEARDPSAPEIKSTADLDKADKALDDTNLDADTSQLDSQLNTF
jgi:hypothetical protein